MGTIFKKIISLAVAGIFTTALPSLAQASFYLGLGYGEVDYDGINRPFNDLLGSTAHGFHRVTDNFYLGQKIFSDQGGQASLIGGYYINDYLSLQLRYGHNSKLHNEATVEGYPPCQSGVDCVAAASWERMLSEVESKSLALRVRADYAISDRWIVSGLAGYSYLFQKIKYSFPEAPVTRISDRVYENGWSYGIGARYQLTPQFAIGAEWMKENLGSIDLESTNLTLEYHFK